MSHPLDDKLQNALKTIDAFSSLLDKETEALARSNFNAFQALQEPKKHLAHAYQDSVLAFEDDLDALKTLDESRKTALQKAYERFRQAVASNESALLVAKKVSERILNLIMTAAKQSVEAPTYGARGKQALSEKIPVHFKLNETF